MIDVVVVYKFSRIFRNAYESHKYRQLFKKRGVKLISVTQMVDDETSSGKLMIGVKVLDFDGTNFHEAVNRVIAECDVVALIIYSKDIVFNDYSEFVFYRIYLDKLNKELITVK